MKAEPTEVSSGEKRLEWRRSIDDRALALPAKKPLKQQAEFYGDVVGWLLSRTAMSPQEVFRRASAVGRRLTSDARIVETPPMATRVFEKLVAAIPDRLRPEPFQFTLTVIDEPQAQIFSPGGGFVFISRGALDVLLADTERGGDQLAFVLAHQLGHICRGHCRRGYQLIRLGEELDDEIEQHINRHLLKSALKSSVYVTGKIVTFLYSKQQQYSADLFALHLCRNIGIDAETCLDVLRSRALSDRTGSLRRSALRRLKQLRMELDGIVPGDNYGLFEFDRKSRRFVKLKNDSLDVNQKQVLFIHGIDAHFGIYQHAIRRLAHDPSHDNLHILGFHYPNDGSLSRSGRFLHREILRVCRSTDHLDFVCHSAGGLVFRYYAEVARGRYRKAVLQGTPNSGSNMAELRVLLEARQFLGDVHLGFPKAIETALGDGKGQITFDLQPDSLFLSHLNRPAREADRSRYYIFRGHAIRSRAAAFLMRTSISAVRGALRRQIARSFESELLAETSLDWINRLRLPREVSHGDLAVTLESATLEGVARVETFPLHHVALLYHPDAVAALVRILFSDEGVADKGASVGENEKVHGLQPLGAGR